MATEVVCGQCQGRLLVEQTGVVVACPHCGAHLSIGAQAPAPYPPYPPSGYYPPQPQAFPQPAPTWPAPVSAPPAPVTQPPVEPPMLASVAPDVSATVEPPVPPEPVAAAQVTTEAATAPSPAWPVVAEPVVEVPAVAAAAVPEPITIPDFTADAPEPVRLPVVNVSPPAASEASTVEVSTSAGAAPVAAVAAALVTEGIAEHNAPVPGQGVSEAAVTIGLPATSSPVANASDFPDFSGIGNISAAASVSAPSAAPEASPASFSTAETGEYPTIAASTPAPRFGTPTEQPATSPAAPAIASAKGNTFAGPTVPKYLFMIVVSYASAITIAFILLYLRGASTLDLPDLVPKVSKTTGQVGLTIIPEGARLPGAYRLRIGESRRYGNVLVTPVKVTRGKLEFTHFSDATKTKPPTESEVLKLWVKFENVSADQTFSPLDKVLLFTRLNDNVVVTQTRSNNYLYQATELKRDGKRVAVYELPVASEWDLKNQQLEQELAPQGVLETYLPTNNEDLSSLTGPLIWRMQFRKGYNPQSGRGVTTVVEVEFDSGDVQQES